MPTAYESGLLIDYLENIVARVHWRDPEAERLIAWLHANEEMLLQARGANALARWLHANADLASARDGPLPGHGDGAAHWAQLGEAFGYVRLASGKVAMDVSAMRLNWLGEQLGLSRIDLVVLETLALYAVHPVVGNLVDTVFTPQEWQRPLVLPERVLACLVGTTPQVLRERLEVDSPLVRFGLAVIEDRWGVGVGAQVRRLTLVSDGKGVRPSWLKRMPGGPFAWTDFEYLGQDRADAETLLASAIERRQRGVNILVHGPADSGKAGFCTALSERVGIDLFRVRRAGACVENGVGDLTLALHAAQSLARNNGRAALLAVGMDVFLARGHSTESLTRLLNDTPVPTLWTVTDTGRIARDVLRQMAFAIRMPPDTDLRARSWVKALASQDVDTTLRDALVLSKDYGAPPGAAADAAAAAGGLGLVARSVQSLAPLLARRRRLEEASVPLRSLADLLPSSVERLNALRHGESVDPEVTTGYEELDSLTGGLQRGELIVVASRPSMGKSALVLNIAEHAAIEMRKSVAIFSLDLTALRVQMRLMSSIARVDQRKVRTGGLTEDDWQRINSAISSMSEARIFIDDSPGLTVAELSDRLGQLKREQSLGLAIVDYLQLIRSDTDPNSSREATVSEAIRSLKDMAKELDVPVIAVSQLSLQLERRSDKQPVLGDLPGSGAIEDHADVILFIYRDEVYDLDSPHKGVADITVAKQRNGPTGEFRLEFSAEHMRFDNRRAPE